MQPNNAILLQVGCKRNLTRPRISGLNNVKKIVEIRYLTGRRRKVSSEAW